MKKTASWLALSAILLAVILMLAQMQKYEPLESITTYRPLIVLSGSMEPTIRVGGVVFSREIDADEVETGDIIVFHTPGVFDMSDAAMDLTTHRVVERLRTEDGSVAFRTKGDANRSSDPWVVTPDRLHGTAGFSVPYFGYVAAFVRRPVGFVLVIVLPVALLVGAEVRNISKAMGKTDEKKTG